MRLGDFGTFGRRTAEKKEKYFKVTVRIYIDQKPVLDRYIAENGTDINTLINELLSDAIIDFKPIRRGRNKPKYS